MPLLTQFIVSQWEEVITFLLVFGRTSGLIVSAPFWGSRIVPVVVRVWTAVLLAFASYSRVGKVALQDLTMVRLIVALAGEIFIGLILGWAAQLVFSGMRLAGQQIETKSGLALLQIVDPNEGAPSGIFSAFLELTAGLIFFSLNGHHLLIQALSSSYTTFPLAAAEFPIAMMGALATSAGTIFSIALRISAPVVIGLLLSDIALGIISRVIPQMNVFIVAQPVQFGLVLFLLMLSLPALGAFFVRQFPDLLALPLPLR
jgi:flagellar biosynthetic protein FliR